VNLYSAESANRYNTAATASCEVTTRTSAASTVVVLVRTMLPTLSPKIWTAAMAITPTMEPQMQSKNAPRNWEGAKGGENRKDDGGKAKGVDVTYLVMDKYLKDMMSDDGERAAREKHPKCDARRACKRMPNATVQISTLEPNKCRKNNKWRREDIADRNVVDKDLLR
jgi:hypothetical protein